MSHKWASNRISRLPLSSGEQRHWESALQSQRCRLLLLLDTEDNGEAAGLPAATFLNQIGCDVKIANVKENMDPDDYIQAYGGEQFNSKVIDVSDTFFKFFMNYKKRDYNLSVDSEKLLTLKKLLNS